MVSNKDNFCEINTDGQIEVLTKFFRGLSFVDQRKIFTDGFKKASRPLINAAQDNAPQGKTGNLKRSIGAVMLTRSIAILVGARKGGGNTRKGWHGHLVEDGTTARFRKDGSSTGTMDGTGFFKSAYKSTEKTVFGSITNEWAQAIDRFIIRTNKRLK